MDYYISPDGNDSSVGTLSSPLKTLDRGLNKAVAGDRIIMREGTYRNRAGWFPTDKATASNPITIEPYPNETVNLSALKELSGWEPFDLTNGRSIYHAPMPFTMCDQSYAVAGEDFLVCNGSVLNEAQWPAANINEYPQSADGWAVVEDGRWISDPSVKGADVTAQIQDSKLLAFPTNSLVGSFITILPGARWTWLSGKVIANEGNSLTFAAKSPGGDSFYKPDGRSLYFLFGKQEFLSYPGSWWRDATSNMVYAWLPNSSNPANSQVEAKQTQKLIDCWSRHYYHFIDLNFIGAVAHTVRASGIVVQGCTFKWYSHRLYHPTSWAWVNPAFLHDSNGLTLRDCDFMDAVGPAVSINGNTNLIVENCTVINSGGLNIGGENSKVFQNTIWKCPYGPAKIRNNINNLKVYNNDIGHGGATIFDEGLLTIATTTTGSAAEVFNNYLHDGHGLSDGSKEFYGTAGLYFDGITAEIKLHHNIISRVTSPGLNICGDLQNILFVNNVFDSSQGVAWWSYKRYPGCRFINNYTTKLHSGTSIHPDMECRQNAFKEISLPDNIAAPDPKFNPDYSLQSGSVLKGGGMVVSGITSTNPPDIGAWEGTRSLVGAVLRKKDLVQIQATDTALASSLKVVLSNLPLGRQPGADFSLRVGDIVALRVGKEEFVAEGFVATESGQPILAKVDADEDWLEIGKTLIANNMNYYVAPNGNDSSSGTIDSPLKTLDRGLNKAVAGDRIIMREGTYRNRAGWFPTEKATASNPISIEAYPGEIVNLSAFKELSGWEPFDLTNGKSIYRAPMPFTMCKTSTAIAGEDFLTCNGVVLNEAQWPAANINEYPQSSSGWATVESGQWISDPSVSKAEVTAQIKDGDLLEFPSGLLVGSYITILLGARWTLLSGKVTAHEGDTLTFVVKSPGGESYYKPDGRSLYFLYGKKELLSYPGSWWRDPESNYVYAWLPDSSNPANSKVEAKETDKVIDFWSRSYYSLKDLNFVGATANITNASGMVFSGCTFKWYSHRIYFDTSWGWVKPAFYTNRNGLQIRDCDFADSTGNVLFLDGNTGLVVENCTVVNTDGVNFGGANSRLAQNTVWHCPYGVIKLSNDLSGSKVYNNDIGYGGLTFFDGGLLLVARTAIGTSAEVYNNLLHDGQAISDGTREFYGTAGLYFEDNTAQITFRHNVVSKVTSPSVNICGSLRNIYFYNNTFDDPQGLAWWSYKQYPGCKFINNYASKLHRGVTLHSDFEYRQNAFKEISVPNNIMTPDPKFNPDYSLQETSPLKGVGVILVGVTSTVPPDIGAWEGTRSLVGAVLRKRDLAQIETTDTALASSLKVALSNLPLGRKPGASFSVRVGDIVATRSGESEFIAENFVAIGTTQPILAKIDSSGDWFQIGSTTTKMAPVINEVSPASGASGDLISITGYGFVPGAIVTLGDRMVVAEVADSGSITFVVP